MRLPDSAHAERPWRIHEIAPDFELEDVWQLDGTLPADRFPALLDELATTDPADSSSLAVRTLFDLRWKLGGLLGWDRPGAGIGRRVGSLSERLPADLRDRPPGPSFAALPFSSLYLLDDEFAAEVANGTMHGVMHIGLVPASGADCQVRMAVLVKPNGLRGRAYMAAIKPFRRLLVYPAMMRELGRRLRDA
jgi:hypothetical protein